MPKFSPLLATAIHTVARGQHGARDLSRAEAAAAFAELLRDDADPMQVGALLIGLRMKGEASEELAGFVEGARSGIAGYGGIAMAQAVDLPCYAGKRRATALHLLAAIRAARSGVPVLIHGLRRIEGRLAAGDLLAAAGIAPAASLSEAKAQLEAAGIAWLPLDGFAPQLAELFALRARLGVRTCVHTVARLLNPLQAGGQLNGFFHTPYGALMGECNALLGQRQSLLFMGAEGEPELYADRQKLLLWQQGEQLQPLAYPEAGGAHYPKEEAEPAALLARFAALLAGAEPDAREAATLMRMQQALVAVQSGLLPGDWQLKIAPAADPI